MYHINAQDLHYGFGQWGTPVKFYLLHQLPTVDVSSVKLAIIHGARVMSTSVSDAVRRKLQTANRTILWTGAPALLKASDDDTHTRHDTVDLMRGRSSSTLTPINSTFTHVHSTLTPIYSTFTLAGFQDLTRLYTCQAYAR